MKQLTQKLSNGEMVVQEVPTPVLRKGMVLVQNYFSIISAGTEGNTAQTARKSLIGKARERPQQVKQVLEVLSQQGPIQTYRAITKKLEAYSPLGYSSSGVVIGVGEGVSEFQIGDKVACAGAGFANHAEIITVPVNLCVKLSHEADLQRASYNTLGAIALQGVRQADLRLGENCAIIGLGLLGQIVGLLLRASGVRVFGIDVQSSAVQMAELHSVDKAFCRSTPGIESQIESLTNGLGVDAVIIAAASSSTDPINFAGAIIRKKGKVVILGDVPTGFDREPNWYKKELELKMSCSYGPGRYDLNYEDKGIDYPATYVRWTEKRNMEAFQHLLEKGIIDIEYLTTHVFNLEDAPKAYDMIVEKSESYFGVILVYETNKTIELGNKIQLIKPTPSSVINLSFIGAGSYAQGNLLPNIPKRNKRLVLKTVLTNTGTTSKRVAERFGFENCSSNEDDIIGHSSTNTVFIATRHDSHAEYTIKALSANQHVFVEKPLCINELELAEIISKYSTKDTPPQIMVGFNRRFSPLSTFLKQRIGNGTMSMLYRVNAGLIHVNSWIQDIEMGGGRIIGETCHFIDYLTFLNGSIPVKVFANALRDPKGLNDTVNITIMFENGSSGVIAYYSNGPKSMPKEYIEVFHAGVSGVINNFKEVRYYGKSKIKKTLFNQDKGQSQMIRSFFDSITSGIPAIPFQEIIGSTKASFAVLESIKTGQPITIRY